MKTLFIIAIVVLLIGLMFISMADAWDDDYNYRPRERKRLRCNPSKGTFEYAYPSDQLKMNPYSGTFEYANPREPLKYNPYTEKWEY